MSAAAPDGGPLRLGGRPLAVLVGLGAASLLLTLALGLFGDALEAVPSVGADSFSRSAVGHRALGAWLEAVGVEASVSRSATPSRVGPGTVLVLAEPDATGAAARARADALLREALERGAEVVLVLPKWEAVPDPERPGWAGAVRLRPLDEAQDALALAAWFDAALEPEAVLRPAPPLAGWRGLPTARPPDLPHPQLLAPGLEGFEPLVAADAGTLVARHRDGVIVLADPDLLNNQGLARGDNAALAHRVLVGETGARRVVVDEVLHGFERPRSVWAELLEPPLALVALHVLGLALLWVWAGLPRFGRPEPLPPRVAPGKGALVAHTAELLTLAGHGAHGLGRYLELSLARAAREQGLPPDLPDAERDARLEALAAARGLGDGPAALRARVARASRRRADARPIRAAARAIHRWRVALRDAPATRGGPPWSSTSSPP